MKNRLELIAYTMFLFGNLFVQESVADSTKVCVEVVEHLPKAPGKNNTAGEAADHQTSALLEKNDPHVASGKVKQETARVSGNGEENTATPAGDGNILNSDSPGKETGGSAPSTSTQDGQFVESEAEASAVAPVQNRLDRSPFIARGQPETRTATFPVHPPLEWTDHAENTNIPLGQTALKYLERLLEHFVTHEVDYEAVEEGCSETLRVELYPLKEGWTAFSRYSGTGREERVDQLFPSELSMFAERVVLALVNDVPISATINRENVLKSDSMKSVQRVKGRSHFVLSVGAQFRMGKLPTWNESAQNSAVESDLRPLFPVKFSLGYRGRFESWGIEALANLGLGTNTQVGKNGADSKLNLNRGHVDYGGDTGVALHFLRYFDPRGLTSFYLGSGATFELLWFRIIEANGADKSTLFSGGLNVDGVFGWEFMRASAVQFLLQGELNVPAYFIRSANDEANLKTWLPGFTVKIGVVF